MDDKRKKRLTWQLPFLALLIIGSILIIRQQQAMPYHHDTGLVFGTMYNITYQHDKNLKEEIEKELHKVDSALSMFNEESVISHVNRNEDYHVNDMFAEVFRLAEKISEDTQGAFDITVAPLVNAWGFGFKNGTMPTHHAIDSLRGIVGYKKIKLNSKTMTVEKEDPRMMLDCSAIAKGYGCDVVARYLRSQDIKNFMIEIGGEVITCGNNPKRLPWRIAVAKPVNDSLNMSNEVQTVLNITDKAMATSGNYRRFYYKNGKKYAHTIDPKTGSPVQHDLLSATVLANDCATADAYATAFMVMGKEKAKKVLDRHPELLAYMIYSDSKGMMEVWYSPNMEKKIHNQ